MSRSFEQFIQSSLIGIVLLGIYVGHRESNRIKQEASQISDSFYLPDGKIVAPILLGHHGFAADLLWIRTLGYVGDEMASRRKANYLETLVNFITDLDPKFEQVYIWAGAVTMYLAGVISKERIMTSTRILEKGWQTILREPVGWKHAPNYWMIPQMIGFNYAIELRDREKGAPYIAAAARLPGSPELYRTWAATMYKKAGRLDEATQWLEDELAIETLENQLNNVEGSAIQGKIRGKLIYYYSRKYGADAVEERLRRIEESVVKNVNRWRETMPYISFLLYLVIRPMDEDIEEIDRAEIGKVSFPLLSAGP